MGKEWLLAVYAVLSFISTVATFSKPFVAGNVRLLVGLSSAVAFLTAIIRVDLKRQKRITELENQIAQLQGVLATHASERKPQAELLIHPGRRSHYVAVRARDQYPFPLKGLHVELDFSVENKGDRASSVNRYDLAFPQFGKAYADVRPYSTNTVKGRHATHLVDAAAYQKPDNFIRVEKESVTGPLLLAFSISDLPLDSFGKRAFEGERETRIFPSINCVLTITDTEKRSASFEFELSET